MNAIIKPTKITFKKCEAEWYNYHNTLKEIAKLREEIMNPFQEENIARRFWFLASEVGETQGRGGEEAGEKDMTAMQYLRNVQTAPAAYRPWIYEGREGCLRLAREVGYCLRDSSQRR